MSLKKKLLVFVLILVIIPQILLGLFSYYLAKKQIAEQTKENLVQEVNNLKSNIETINQQIIELIRAQIVTIKTKAWAGLNADNLHASIESDELTLVAGDGSKRAYKTGNNELVDYIIKNIGSDYVAGIYRFENDKAICLSTNILKDGKRIIGAKLETEIVKKISETKEEFAGKELIDGEEYFTIYSPIFDKEHKKIIALIMVGRSISKMVDTLAANTNKIKVGETGYAYILNSKGMLVTHPSIRGKNISQYDFVQEMIKAKSGYLSYVWEKREKIVAYSYVEKNDWIIAAGSYYDEFDAVLSKLRWITIFVICLTSLISTFVVVMLAKGIATPVTKIAEDLKNISEQVESASKQLSDASQNLSESSATQASSMEETSSSLDEIRAMVETNTQNAMQAEKLALAVKNNTERGNAAMDELIVSMREILQSNEQIEKMAKLISEIGEKTQIIDEIVFQTKLLSFNASVEAERAGEHGRGFAVVAQEVGNLAQMSGKAANEVTAIVSMSIRNAEMITKENRKKVEEGNNLVKEAASVLKDTVMHAQQVSDNSSLVVKASKEQLAGIKQINTAMSQINEITQRTAATAEESSSASEELLAQATGLSETVTILEDLVSGRKV